MADDSKNFIRMRKWYDVVSLAENMRTIDGVRMVKELRKFLNHYKNRVRIIVQGRLTFFYVDFGKKTYYRILFNQGSIEGGIWSSECDENALSNFSVYDFKELSQIIH